MWTPEHDDDSDGGLPVIKEELKQLKEVLFVTNFARGISYAGMTEEKEKEIASKAAWIAAKIAEKQLIKESGFVCVNALLHKDIERRRADFGASADALHRALEDISAKDFRVIPRSKSFKRSSSYEKLLGEVIDEARGYAITNDGEFMLDDLTVIGVGAAETGPGQILGQDHLLSYPDGAILELVEVGVLEDQLLWHMLDIETDPPDK